LLYLRQYLELWVMFEAIDTNKDKRISSDEFAVAAKLVGTWGLKIDDPAAVFAEIDGDGGGMILFDEFADWAIRKQLDLPDDDDAESAGAGSGVTRTGPDIKVRGLAKKQASPPGGAKPGVKPGSPATKTPVKPVTATAKTTPSPRPAAAVAVKPATTPSTTAAKPASPPPASVRGRSPGSRSEPKPAWGSSKASEKKAPPPPAAATTKAAPAPAAAASAQKVSLGIKFEAAEGGGVTVTSVNPDSTSQKAGVQVGDILKTMAGKAIGNKEDFKAILVTLEPGSTVDVTAKRGADDVALKYTF